RLTHGRPTSKQHWLGILGLAAELNVDLDPLLLTDALRSDYSTVRHAAVTQLRDEQLPLIIEALDDPSDRLFAAAIERLRDQPWSMLQPGVDAIMDRGWHELAPTRREAMLHLRPRWQQVHYLLARFEAEPTLQAFWLRQLTLWCDRQYQMVDHETPKAERDLLMARLKQLGAKGLLPGDSVRQVVG
ncbi:MAG TPA: hypothetical protein VJB68_08670, partial [Methylophilaceae bacterium]|nr:hypothetical protein [Methylophilaceae bacterium]